MSDRDNFYAAIEEVGIQLPDDFEEQVEAQEEVEEESEQSE